MKRTLLRFSLALCIAAPALGQTTIMSENMGLPVGAVPVGQHTFQNSGTYTYGGNVDAVDTTPSSGYAAASGGGNILFPNISEWIFDIMGINTMGFTDIALSFGAHKQLSSSDMSEFTVYYGTDPFGGLTQLNVPLQPSGAGTAGWRLIELPPGSLPAASNLRLRFIKAAGSGAIRLDDVRISGLVGSSPTLTTMPTALAFGDVAVGANSNAQVLMVNASALIGVPGSIIVNNPPGTDFRVSLNGTDFSGSVQIPYTASSIPPTPVYVRFSPTSAGPQSGNISFVITGGGTAPTVPVTGNGTTASSVGEQAGMPFHAWHIPGAVVVEGALATPLRLRLLDMTGKAVVAGITMAPGTQRMEIPTAFLPGGVYVLEGTTDQGRWGMRLAITGH